MFEKIAMLPLRNLFSDLYSTAKGPIKQILKGIVTDEINKKRINYAESIGRIKTIWQIDKYVSIFDFYYPTKIQFGGSVKTIESIEELIKENATIVEGIAGQGKSILMRYLCMTALKEEKWIPVFIQLRGISEKAAIEDLIADTFISIGIINDSYVKDYFLNSGKVILVLDGFDEIDTEFRADTIAKLEKYLRNYKKLKIIVSSRPDSDIQHSPCFGITKIKPLEQRDREKLISHLVDNEKVRDMVINSLYEKYIHSNGEEKKRPKKVTGILTTPLLVTLLVITYKSESEVPESLSVFYQSLFSTLIKRHDKTKPGFIREKYTELGNIEFEKVFENLCFNNLSNYLVSMSEREFYEATEISLEAEGLRQIKPENYMKDITKITCLIVLDGDKYYYLHKSIIEYFAAQKVSEEKNPENKKFFYQQLVENSIPENWYQTLKFLNEIDNFCYCSYLLLPYYCKTFGVDINDIPKEPKRIDRDFIVNLLGPEVKFWLYRQGTKNVPSTTIDVDRVSVDISMSTPNWLTNVYLLVPIRETLENYINSMTSFSRKPLINLNTGNKENSLVYCFDKLNLWNEFLESIDLGSPLKKAYFEIFSIKKKIENRKKLSKPIFKIKLG